jgi:hypothetical protein
MTKSHLCQHSKSPARKKVRKPPKTHPNLLLLPPRRNPTTPLSSRKEKGKGVRKGNPTPKAIINGTHKPIGPMPGTTTTLSNIPALLPLTANGTHPQKKKAMGRARVTWTMLRDWTLKFTGVIFTKNMAIQQNGASTTLTTQVVQLLEMVLTGCGVPRDKGKGKRQGASTYGNRQWKNQNFPANYNSDQAQPALHDESSSSANGNWWDDHELGSAVFEMDNEPNPDTIDEDDDEDISDYIDLILFAIVTNMERHKAYFLNQTRPLLDEIYEHSTYIANAESSLNIHIRRIIHNFKATIHYDALMSCDDMDTFTTAHTALELVEIDKAHDSTVNT